MTRRLILQLAFLATLLTLSTHGSAVAQVTFTWTVEDGLPSNEIRALLRDSHGRIWFGSRDGISVLDSGTWTRHGAFNGMVGDGVASLMEDAEGRVWAVGGGGYSVWADSAWTAYDNVAGLRPRVVFSASQGPGGQVWVGMNGGAARVDTTGGPLFTEAEGLPHQVVHDVLRVGSGQVWFASRTGLAVWDGVSMAVLHPGTNFGSILVEQSGALWFGTRSAGAFRFDQNFWVAHAPSPDLRPVLQDSSGRIWAVTDESGVFVLDRGAWTGIGLAEGLPSDTVFDVVENVGGDLLVATDRGVSRLAWAP